jgi:hypothetical protein
MLLLLDLAIALTTACKSATAQATCFHKSATYTNASVHVLEAHLSAVGIRTLCRLPHAWWCEHTCRAEEQQGSDSKQPTGDKVWCFKKSPSDSCESIH